MSMVSDSLGRAQRAREARVPAQSPGEMPWRPPRPTTSAPRPRAPPTAGAGRAGNLGRPPAAAPRSGTPARPYSGKGPPAGPSPRCRPRTPQATGPGRWYPEAGRDARRPPRRVRPASSRRIARSRPPGSRERPLRSRRGWRGAPLPRRRSPPLLAAPAPRRHGER